MPVIYCLIILLSLFATDACVAHAVASLPTVKIKTAPSEWERFRKSRPAEASPLFIKLMDSAGKMVYHGNPRNLARRFASRRRQSYRISIPDPSGRLPDKTIIYRAKPEDKTSLREWLAYRMFAEAGITSPSARLVLLEVNGTSLGVFVEVIPVDSLFVRKLLATKPMRHFYITVILRESKESI